jgi:hypothetical protein|tara:strand:- start:899 stop:1189 length:291 start_codon:yes stop_codon:yes gene_type:complete
MRKIDWTACPGSELVGPSLQTYVEHGIEPGHFLTGVLMNDLLMACTHADPQNEKSLRWIVTWVFNMLPMGCYGSKDNVAWWLTLPDEEREAYLETL